MKEALVARRFPILAAGLSLAGGFVTMSLVSLVWNPNSALPGMWDYWSGTVGDLLLPVVLYGVTRGCILLQELPHQKPARVSWAVGLFGAGLGALSQIAWLADSSPRLNWMLIQPHRFSAAGWYHAAFLVATAGYVAGATFELLNRARARRRTSQPSEDGGAVVRSVLSGAGSAIVSCSGALFILTVIVDSLPSRTTSSSMATIGVALAAPVLVLGVGAILLGGDVRHILAPTAAAMASVVCALTFAASPIDTPKTSFAAASALLTGIGLSTAVHREERILLGRGIVPVVPPIACLLVVGVGLHTPTKAVWTLFIALFVAVAVLMLLDRRVSENAQLGAIDASSRLGKQVALVMAGAVCLLAILSAVLSPDDRTGRLGLVLLSVIFAIPLSKLVTTAMNAMWRPMWTLEKELHGLAPDRSSRLQTATLRSWIGTSATGLGTFLALVPMGIASAGGVLTRGAGTPTRRELSIVVVAMTIAVLASLPTTRALFHKGEYKRDTPPRKATANHLILALATAGLVILATATTILAIMAGWHGWISAAVLAPILVISIDCLVTLVVDSTFMCLRWPDWVDWVGGCVAGVAAGTSLYWALLSGASSGGVRLEFGLLLFGIAVVIRLVVNLVAGGVIYARGSRLPAIEWSVGWIHVQNELIRSFIGLGLLLVPVFVLTHSDQLTWETWLIAVSATVGIEILAGPVYVFGMRRQLEHAYEQREIRFDRRHMLLRPTPRRLVRESVDFIRDFLEWVHGNRKTRQASSGQLSEEGFVLAQSANLGFQVLVRTATLVASVVGLVGMFTAYESSSGLGWVDPAVGAETPFTRKRE